MTNTPQIDIGDEDEQLTGNQCPRCGFPTVLEYGLEVCYGCGWSNDSEVLNA